MFILELSFADLPSPVIAHIISIITVILELSVNSDRYVIYIDIEFRIILIVIQTFLQQIQFAQVSASDLDVFGEPNEATTKIETISSP